MTLALNSLTPRARRTVLRATAEAEGREQGFVGTEHLLLALALDRHGVAGQVLDQLGVREMIVERVAAFISSEGGGDARDDGDEARVAFDASPRSNHRLVVMSMPPGGQS